jgi:hypothetical protein
MSELRPYLPGSDKQRLRKLLDQHYRARLAPRPGCWGCGCHHDNYTIGCAKCADRRRGRAKRQREKEAARGRDPATGRYL